jgi:hypothetical protein
LRSKVCEFIQLRKNLSEFDLFIHRKRIEFVAIHTTHNSTYQQLAVQWFKEVLFFK